MNIPILITVWIATVNRCKDDEFARKSGFSEILNQQTVYNRNQNLVHFFGEWI